MVYIESPEPSNARVDMGYLLLTHVLQGTAGYAADGDKQEWDPIDTTGQRLPLGTSNILTLLNAKWFCTPLSQAAFIQSASWGWVTLAENFILPQ